jgi:hypothetical protein
MRRTLALACVLFGLTAGLACDDSGAGSGPANDNGNAEVPPGDGETAIDGETPAADVSPTAFEEARDSFAARVQAIGPNIGSVPDDIRGDLLTQCEALGEYADGGDVDDICSAVERAMNTGDFGLIDLILLDLAGLEEE